jgi:hypothetical protein
MTERAHDLGRQPSIAEEGDGGFQQRDRLVLVPLDPVEVIPTRSAADRNPATYGSFFAVASIAAPASSSAAAESSVANIKPLLGTPDAPQGTATTIPTVMESLSLVQVADG